MFVPKKLTLEGQPVPWLRLGCHDEQQRLELHSQFSRGATSGTEHQNITITMRPWTLLTLNCGCQGTTIAG